MSFREFDLLFHDPENNEFDGDLRIEDGDFKTASIEETAKQEIMNRLKTNNPDWYRHYQVGADLEDIRGEDNTEITADEGREKILNALTHDGLFNASQLRIEPIPTDVNEITYFIFVDLGYKEPLVVEYTLDIE